MNSGGLISAQPTHRVAIALGVLMLAAGTAVGAAPASVVDLPVVLRDFSRDHPDFYVTPPDGYGYYFGNVALDLDDEGKPLFTGGGFRAQSLWFDALGHPIAPHLFNTCGFLTPLGGGDPEEASFYLTVDETIVVDKRSVIDSFDSREGPYSDRNSGAEALVRVNGPEPAGDDDDDDDDDADEYVEVKDRSTIMGDVMVGPGDDLDQVVEVKRKSAITGTIGQLEAEIDMPVVEPPDLGPRVKKLKFRRGEHTLSADVRCKQLKLKKRAVLNIEGDVTIWCEKKLELDDDSEIRLMPDATLTLYVGEKIEVDDDSKINMNTGDPRRVSILMLGDPDDGESKIKLDDGGMLAAWVQGADTYLKIEDGSEFFGSFIGKKVKVKKNSRFHVDMAAGSGGGAVVFEPEECELGDVPGAIRLMSDGDVLSAGTFAEWWRDVLGVNMTTVQTIRLTRNAYGVYFYLHDNYRPLDGQLLGNESDLHNYHFTVELDASFTYDASAGQWFEFRCTDDAYVFINGRLVLDQGGYGFNKVQYVDLDRLGLPDGKPARLQLFHAQRQRGLAIFRIKTNIELAGSTADPSVNSILED
jgi:fibro-slime domain-containing protein